MDGKILQKGTLWNADGDSAFVPSKYKSVGAVHASFTGVEPLRYVTLLFHLPEHGVTTTLSAVPPSLVLMPLGHV